MISPRGVCRASANSIARRTAGHIWRTKSSSPVTRNSCQVPTATYATWLLSAALSVTTSPTVFFGHEPSGRWVTRSQS